MARTAGGESQGPNTHDRDVVFVGVGHHLAHDGVAEPVEVFMGMLLDGGQQPAQAVVEGFPPSLDQAVGVEQESRAAGRVVCWVRRRLEASMPSSRSALPVLGPRTRVCPFRSSRTGGGCPAFDQRTRSVSVLSWLPGV